MKKVMVVILAAVMLFAGSACGTVVECDFCNNEHPEKHLRSAEIFDETMYMCDDCYNNFAEMFE